MDDTVTLRPTTAADIPVFFQIESDPEARHMAAFGDAARDSLADFQARWSRILGDSTVTARTVLWNGQVVGSAAEFVMFEKPSVSYWIAREAWGRGVATRALTALLHEIPLRPLFARVAKDNHASRKVLENCGFSVIGEDTGFAGFRGTEVEELIYRLDGP